MASEPQTRTVEEIALDAVDKIDGYLCGDLTTADVIAWAKEWEGRHSGTAGNGLIVESAIDMLLWLEFEEGRPTAELLREFRAYLLGEKDYVIHHRMVHRKSDRLAALRKT